MRKTPTTLKWLAEARARHAHDLERTERIAIDVNQRLVNLRQDLAGLDRVLSLYDKAIDPTLIEPINAFQGRYGKRGALGTSLTNALKALAPEWVSTDNIELLVCLDLGLVFDSPRERKRWYENSLTSRLRRFVEAGLVERQHDPSIQSSEVGRWRWVQLEGTKTLSELRAEADGV